MLPHTDGSRSQHAGNARDEARTLWLQGEGYRVFRFWNNDVLGNMEGVFETIRASLSAPAPTQPSP